LSVLVFLALVCTIVIVLYLTYVVASVPPAITGVYSPAQVLRLDIVVAAMVLTVFLMYVMGIRYRAIPLLILLNIGILVVMSLVLGLEYPLFTLVLSTVLGTVLGFAVVLALTALT